MAMADITVRGAGIFGLSIAWVLVQRGARVQLIDPFGAGAGSSGGIVGALAPHVPENWNAKKAFQFDSLRMTAPFWAGVQDAGGVDPGYRRSGRLQPVADAAALDLARRRALTATDLWQGFAQWRVVARSEFGAWAPPSPTGYLIHDTLSAHLHPRRACAALVAALATKGVTVQPDATHKGAVIWATGWQGLQELSAQTGKPVGNGVKGQAALFDYDGGDGAQLFADALHIIPHGDGTVAVGSTSERAFSAPGSTDAALDDVIARARAALPLLQDARVIARWAGVRPRAKSRAPVLGAHPLTEGHFIANGGFKIGFGMAVKVAQV
ncbi:MAG: NAD(P)/FAD-dependent oxidoreductase, partial [Sedimentitalea sp.]